VRKRFSPPLPVRCAVQPTRRTATTTPTSAIPFTFRYANLYNLAAEYSLSDRDEAHKFNAMDWEICPSASKGTFRIQQHSAEPETDNVLGTGTGAPCSFNNSATRFVNGIDCGRNHLRKDNAFFVLDFGVARPLHFHDNKFQSPSRRGL